MHLIDITRPVRPGIPVWPGDAPCRLEWTSRIGTGDPVNASALCMSAHTGTHADAPFHVLDDGARIGELPLDAYLGPVFVAHLPRGGMLDAAWTEALLRDVVPTRLLVRTGCWKDPDTFPMAFAAPTPEAAEMLVDSGVRLFGTDAPSVDPFDAAVLHAHRVFCGRGVAILENLLLDDVAPGSYELIALPLRLVGGDGSPVRAVLRAP